MTSKLLMEMSRKISWCVTSKCSTVNVSGSLVRVIDFVFTSEINVLCVMMIVEGGGGGSIHFSIEIPDLIKVEKRGVYPAVQYYSVLRDR